eukprot:13543321-Ditylum_brightwellii.AAC.1
MAYRRYTNLCEKFQGDLISKVNADVKSLDFMDQPCNCSRPCKVNGACTFKGCTQDAFKARMVQHFNDVYRLTSSTKLKLLEDDKRNSDKFTKHFANYFPCDSTPQLLHKNISFDIL